MKLFAMLLLATMCAAQDTPVVALSPADVDKVKATHEAMLKAEKDWNDLQGEITRRYLIVDKGSPEASMEPWYPPITDMTGTFTVGVWHVLGNDECDPQYKVAREEERKEEEKRLEQREAKARRFRKGWVKDAHCSGCGVLDFEYSTDWKYIVPKPNPPAQPYNSMPWIVSPAIGGIGTLTTQ